MFYDVATVFSCRRIAYLNACISAFYVLPSVFWLFPTFMLKYATQL